MTQKKIVSNYFIQAVFEQIVVDNLKVRTIKKIKMKFSFEYDSYDYQHMEMCKVHILKSRYITKRIGPRLKDVLKEGLCLIISFLFK